MMTWLTSPSPVLAATLTAWFGAILIGATLIVVAGLAVEYLKTPYLRRVRLAFPMLVIGGAGLQAVALAGSIWFAMALQNLTIVQERQALRAELSSMHQAGLARLEASKLRDALGTAGAARQALEDENQDLKQSLGEANSELASLQAKAGIAEAHSNQRRLKVSDRLALAAALMPFAKQKVQIFSIDGDVEGKNYRDDFVRIFDRAGWDHDGRNGVVQAAFDVDPVGITIILHQVDAGHGHTNKAINALVATLKRLDLFQGGGVFISDQVPDGTVKVAIGKMAAEVASKATPTRSSALGTAGAYSAAGTTPLPRCLFKVSTNCA